MSNNKGSVYCSVWMQNPVPLPGAYGGRTNLMLAMQEHKDFRLLGYHSHCVVLMGILPRLAAGVCRTGLESL